MRRIVCAANRCNEPHRLWHLKPVIILGARHFDERMHEQIRILSAAGFNLQPSLWEQGFIDQHGVFLTREEAWIVASDANQIIKRVGGDGLEAFGLFSENLY